MKSKKFVLILMVVSMLFFMSSFVSAQTTNASSAQLQSTYQSQNVYTFGEGETVDDSNLQHKNFSSGGVSSPQANFPFYYGPVRTDGRFEPAHDTISFKNSWSEDEARALAGQPGGEVKFSLSGIFSKAVPPTKSIKFVIMSPPDDKNKMSQYEKTMDDFKDKYELIRTGYFYSDGKIVSSKILGEVALQGLKSGADVILYTEGYFLRLEAESWAIGIGTTVSAVSGGGPTSNGVGSVQGGGIGWANAWAEYQTKPWLRVKYFRAKDNLISIRNLGTSKEAPGASEAKNGEIFKPEASPSQLQTGANGNKDGNQQIRKLNPGAVQQP